MTLNYVTLASDQVDVSSVLQAGGFVVPRGKAFTSIRLSSFGTFCCCPDVVPITIPCGHAKQTYAHVFVPPPGN